MSKQVTTPEPAATIERPNAAAAMVTAVTAAIDRTSAAVLDDLDRLSKQIDALKAEIVASGNEAKDQTAAHLDIAEGADTIRVSLETSIAALRDRRRGRGGAANGKSDEQRER